MSIQEEIKKELLKLINKEKEDINQRMNSLQYPFGYRINEVFHIKREENFINQLEEFLEKI